MANCKQVQFEVHQNRFADFRKIPDLPPLGREDYCFEPADLLPPVGGQYLLHLFKHPEDYDGELITYLRAPKKQGRLQIGVGWYVIAYNHLSRHLHHACLHYETCADHTLTVSRGINLVEGFLPNKVWMVIRYALLSIGCGIMLTVCLAVPSSLLVALRSSSLGHVKQTIFKALLESLPGWFRW